MSIAILRLRSGEDILCDIVSEDNVKYIIKDPAVIMPIGRDDNGTVQIGLSPWMPYSKSEEFNIPVDFVVTEAEPSQEISNTYSEMYGKIIATKTEILM